MNQEHLSTPAPLRRLFTSYYERMSQGTVEKTYMEPLRKKIVGQAAGLVLEVGAGNGLNFACYDPEFVERVEATELDNSMLSYARARAQSAPVSVTLTQANVEQLPFADAYFDCIVCTLVFCSVNDPLRGLQEMRRVLKPGGQLLMIEHVRAQKRMLALLQDLITPLTRLLLGNCHWNRSTVQTVQEAGFQDIRLEHLTPVGELMPLVIILARG
ncbi:class I SAM-dependent methyltransferase [Ktedonobacter racemifer]|uniref:Methyltransferase type 11 n=1 Tax=Ktedonobacter racemifer DSM 44963 TaxID=485913 RepID=D6U0S9_KTERA|nr:class I SAM-dependent methyltransferase [Ktedonobacter racemifer]EFH82419.1 Methyltransferase type 11 [Ktedonobacter racemifer DSM 44963]